MSKFPSMSMSSSRSRWLQFAAWILHQRLKLVFSRHQYRFRCSPVFLRYSRFPLPRTGSRCYSHKSRLSVSFLQGILGAVQDTSRVVNPDGLTECVLHSSDFFPSCRHAFDLSLIQIPSVVLLGRFSATLSLLNSVGAASIISGLVLYVSNRFSLFCDPSSNWSVNHSFSYFHESSATSLCFFISL